MDGFAVCIALAIKPKIIPHNTIVAVAPPNLANPASTLPLPNSFRILSVYT
jgi:hypothetical protein